MRYEDMVALGDFSPRLAISNTKTYQMMVEKRLRTRGDHDEKKYLWCCVNGGMGEDAFGAQELKVCSAFTYWIEAMCWLTSRACICMLPLAKDRPVIRITLAMVRSSCSLSGLLVWTGRSGLAE